MATNNTNVDPSKAFSEYVASSCKDGDKPDIEDLIAAVSTLGNQVAGLSNLNLDGFTEVQEAFDEICKKLLALPDYTASFGLLAEQSSNQITELKALCAKIEKDAAANVESNAAAAESAKANIEATEAVKACIDQLNEALSSEFESLIKTVEDNTKAIADASAAEVAASAATTKAVEDAVAATADASAAQVAATAASAAAQVAATEANQAAVTAAQDAIVAAIQACCESLNTAIKSSQDAITAAISECCEKTITAIDKASTDEIAATKASQDAIVAELKALSDASGRGDADIVSCLEDLKVLIAATNTLLATELAALIALQRTNNTLTAEIRDILQKKPDAIKVLHKIVGGVNGVISKRWTANAATHGPTDSIFDCGVHVNGAPDAEVVHNNLNLNDTIFGGDPDNANASQELYETVVYFPQTVSLVDTNQNNGEQISVNISGCNDKPVKVAGTPTDNDTGIGGANNDLGLLTSVGPGFVRLQVEISDSGAFGGINIRESFDGGLTSTVIPDDRIFVQTPPTRCVCVAIKDGAITDLLTGAEITFDPDLCSWCPFECGHTPAVQPKEKVDCFPKELFEIEKENVWTEQKWTGADAIQNTAIASTVGDTFTGTDSEGYPTHANPPTTVQNITNSATTNVPTPTGESDQAQVDGWLCLPRAVQLVEDHPTAETVQTWLSEECGSNQMALALDAPNQNQGTNNLGTYGPGFIRARLYHHDPSFSGINFLKYINEDGVAVRIPQAWMSREKPRIKCIDGWHCCDGKYFNSDKSAELNPIDPADSVDPNNEVYKSRPGCNWESSLGAGGAALPPLTPVVVDFNSATRLDFNHNANGGTSNAGSVDNNNCIRSFSEMSFGPGIQFSGSTFEWVASGFDESTKADAVAADDYFEMSFTAASDGALTTWYQGLEPQRNSTGAGDYNFCISISDDGFATSKDIVDDGYMPDPQTGGDNGNNTRVNNSIDVDDCPLTQNTTYTIRYYIWNTGASGPNGSARLPNSNQTLPAGSASLDDVAIGFECV